MRRTFNVLFNGRDKFKKGDIFAKHKILQILDSNSDLQIKNTSNEAVCQ